MFAWKTNGEQLATAQLKTRRYLHGQRQAEDVTDRAQPPCVAPIRIKDARMARIDPHQRPYYPRAERMAVLELKAARGWSVAQAARAFLVEPATIASWLQRIDEKGDEALVQLRRPVNKFPDFVRYVVQS